ncbi:Rhomboid domain-containing protein [Cephalotus follicularis]|uniref:Rhomboid domain-containing protein n=1 Tax=Cephalotus follicularis TaxID=3775 RepID=A0A1Q3C4Y6_CEPFO|nr:Rhomboid domain-containing protein [Cephalotus follicularis]
MQRLFSLKLASNVSRELRNTTSPFSLVHSHPFKSISSLTKPTQNQLMSSSLPHSFTHSHSWMSHNTLSGKTHGFLSNPFLLKQFLLNLPRTHLRVPSKRLMDCKVPFFGAQFQRRIFHFDSGSRSYRGVWRSWFQRLTASEVILGLIVANVAVFMLWRIADQRFMVNNFTISLENFRSGRLHTLITSAFSHISTEHLVSNMIGLYFFGMSMGRNFGPEFLLKLYLAGAVGGSVFYLVHHAFLVLSSKGQRTFMNDPSTRPGLVYYWNGASGAVNAIMLLDIFLNPKATLYLDFIIPVPAMLLGIFLIGKDMLRVIEGNSHVSGSAHLGGAAVAALAWLRIRRGRF